MLRTIAVAAAVAALGLAVVTTDASARSQGGARGFSGSFRGAAPAFRGGSSAFRANGFTGPGVFRNINPGVRFANPGFRHHGNGFRRFGFVGLPLAVGAYGAYSYYNDCVVPQNVLTPYGWQTRLVNVCDDYPY